MGLERPDSVKLLIKQITGVLARRIVCPAKSGDVLARGERYGMIKFGSRTELYIPIGVLGVVSVKLGDKVVGGETPVATLQATVTQAAAKLQETVSA
jgi:phosphatidylserine decarboxylase